MDGPWKEKLGAIERELQRALPPAADLPWLAGRAGEPLRAFQPGTLDRILAPGRELLGRGGKRWRPLLLLGCAEMFGFPWREALPLTPLVEVAHNGSLIVDDVEDSSPQRRGGPAIHTVFGLDAALNTGNLMYFLAVAVVEGAGLPAPQQLAILRRYLQGMVRLHVGQGLDILWHGEHRTLPSVASYLQMCRLKTGSLSRLAAQAGAIAGGATEPQADALGVIAEEFGACFQIIDDVANLDSGVPGKLRGDDIIEGKKSLPVILHLQRRPDDAGRVRECFEAAAADPVGSRQLISELVERLQDSGSLAEARGRAEDLLSRTEEQLLKQFPPSAARQGLLDLVGSLVRPV